MNRIDAEEINAVLEVMIRGYKGDMEELVTEITQFLYNHEPAPDVTLSGFYKDFRGGPSVQKFEKAITKYTGAAWTRTVTNGTSALHLALTVAGVGRGMKVVVPPLTFSATGAAVLMVGAEPVFCDVEESSYNMDPEALEKIVKRETISAVIPVHLLGVPCRMDGIMHLAQNYNFIVIEDNAQALGAKYRRAMTGAWGHFATLSFQETKTMTSLGEGGAVLGTGDESYGDRIASLRNHGQQYASQGVGTEAREICWNYRMSEAQAAMGIVQLSKLPHFNTIQRENREIFKDMLEPYGFVFQEAPKDAIATYYILGTTHHDPEYSTKVVNALHEAGWGQPRPGATIGFGYKRTIMDLPLFRAYKRLCPVSEWLVKHYVWWDIHRWIDKVHFILITQRIEDIIKTVK